jgi:hypothetical protein
LSRPVRSRQRRNVEGLKLKITIRRWKYEVQHADLGLGECEHRGPMRLGDAGDHENRPIGPCLNRRPFVGDIEIMTKPSPELTGEHARIGFTGFDFGFVDDRPKGKGEGVFQVAHRKPRYALSLLNQFARRRNVRNDLIRVGADADVAEIGQRWELTATRGETDDFGEREGHVTTGFRR